MSQIIIDIENNFLDINYQTDNNKIYHIGRLKDSILNINKLTNKTVIKLVTELTYRLGNALKYKFQADLT